MKMFVFYLVEIEWKLYIFVFLLKYLNLAQLHMCEMITFVSKMLIKKTTFKLGTFLTSQESIF